MKILIHTCCADCFLNTLNYLKEKSLINSETEIVAFFFNPNIHPRAEYLERLNALKKVIEQLDDRNIKLVIPDYKPKEYISMIRGNEKNIKLSRCNKCWNLRLEKSFEYAQEIGADTVTTTLLTSHYQNREDIRKIGKDISTKYNIDFLNIDSSCNCHNHGFYKQNYCGCCFSLTEKMLQLSNNE